MNAPGHETRLWSEYIAADVAALVGGRLSPRQGHAPPGPHTVPADFFGICVATGQDPACDDYVLGQLASLKVRCVRLDFTYASRAASTERFLRRLLQAGFRVCLHLVQPIEEARRMDAPASQEAWRQFVAAVMTEYGRPADMIEVGSTCNRRKWAGYSLSGFLTAWRIAFAEAQRHGLGLAGPNVTDFEPLHSAGLLSILRRRQLLPQVHTDNLFAERATEPEAYDPKIAGRRMAPILKFNLIKKARVIHGLSAHYCIARTMCTHVAWSLRRIARTLADTEQKQADYVARYCCLAAASGALDRVYWGPLIGQREGLIDDGTQEYPEIPHVTLYGQLAGSMGAYRRRPAFDAFRTCSALLAGATFRRCVPALQGLEIHEFDSPEGLLHVVWTRNGAAAAASDCYTPEARASASARSRDGIALSRCPSMFSESPVYLLWAAPSGPPAVSAAPRAIAGVRFYSSGSAAYSPVDDPSWTGFSAHRAGRDARPLPTPEDLERAPDSETMRDKRNRVWSMPDPRGGGPDLVVKRFRAPRGYKRLLQRWKPSRARRSWNGANELLRRGIATPAPVAFFEKPDRPVLSECYYVCERHTGSGSVRTAFTAFAGGAPEFGGMGFEDFGERLSAFLCLTHGRGVFFRDLSAGNILLRSGASGGPEFSLIDTARARFYDRPITTLQRLRDLVRICHPLDWRHRTPFLRIYMRGAGLRFRPWMLLPFAAYDAKHVVKRWLRGPRRLLAGSRP